MTLTYTLQAPAGAIPTVRAAVAQEHFTDLDRARFAAVELCCTFGVDIEVVQHLGAASCVWETYDFATYGGHL